MGSPPDRFSYAAGADGTVRVRRGGRVVTTLRGAAATRFLSDVQTRDPQQLMARVTGDYRRGNERTARSHPRNRGR